MDLNTTAFRIVQHLTTEDKTKSPQSLAKKAAGRVGGQARAKRLGPEQRKAIAIKANRARWQKSKKVSA
jgi:hypothetical protein